MAAERYEITVEGQLDPAWEAYCGGMSIRHVPGGETMLVGELADQAALHGVLALVRDLNLRLIAVRRLAPGPQNGEKE